MLLYSNRIVVTGGTGRFASSLKKVKSKYSVFFPSKSNLNILKENSILKYLKNKKPKYLIHLAGLSRPMSVHNNDIKKSIDLNIIGTANIVKVCEKVVSKNFNIFYPVVFIKRQSQSFFIGLFYKRCPFLITKLVIQLHFI